MTAAEPGVRVALITGANSGIGRVTALELAKRGYRVFLACRSEDKTRPVLDEIRAATGGKAQAEFLPLDLGDLASVRACAQSFLARGLPLHLLVANAGLAGAKGLSKSGFEVCFGTCHVGHFLLTQLLLDRLKVSAPARVVVVASKLHRNAKAIDFETLKRPPASVAGLGEYAVAKLANVLFAAELGRRLQGSGVTTYSLHPGVVATDIYRTVPWPLDRLIKLFMISEEDGAKTSLHCATAPALAGETGLYYDECRPRKPSPLALDAALAKRLWDESERWVAAA